MWKCGSKWTLLVEIKCDHTREPREALQFKPQLWAALSHGALGVARRKTEGILSLWFSLFSVWIPNECSFPLWFLFPAFSNLFSLLSHSFLSLEKVFGPLGDSRMWLHELLELTKTYSFPINLPRAYTQQLRIPSMGLAKVLRKAGCVPKSYSLWVPRIVRHWHQDILKHSSSLLNLPLISQKFGLGLLWKKKVKHTRDRVQKMMIKYKHGY